MKKNSREKIKYANFAAGLTLIGAVLILAIYFINIQIDLTSKKLIVQKMELIALSNREKLSSDLAAENQSLEKEIRRVENALPSHDGIINFIKDLEKLAQNTNTKMVIRFTEKPEIDAKTGNPVLVFNIDIEGSESSLNSFMGGLNQLPYFIKVYQVNENIDQFENIRASLKLGVFVNENF